jgi:hypothetical protein
MSTAYHLPAYERRYAGLALTLMVHAALFLGWQMSRQAAPADTGPDPVRIRIQWIRLPAPVSLSPPRKPEPAPRPERPAAAAARLHPAARAPEATPTAPSAPPAAAIPAATPAAPSTPAADTAPAAPRAAPFTAAPAAPTGAEILQRARRDIGKIDRALRKENNPYIVAPPDSPQIRMRKGIEAANDAVPPKLWEAPKIDTLVNDTGDGARRGRVRTGNGTYCITDRPLNTSIDMIEKHGKQRLTNCPQHELPPSKQDWRTARD